MIKSLTNSVRKIFQNPVGFDLNGILAATFIFVVVALLFIPLHPRILDLFLVSNMMFALILLLGSLLVVHPISFLSFPKVLLLFTFFRLALNVSSTRLILSEGDKGMDAAGQVIESFGNIIVSGDFIVGVILFAIISIVNFVVIAKGSARVAEVSARFSLDAMPGKQFAIDADLRSGNITKDVAAFRRDLLNKESHFFGSMDGAMKFVQGDAVAGLVITFINAVGGVLIGVRRGLGVEDAISTFGVLTIGDGLVNILPALLVSVSAGIIVTHVTKLEDSSAHSQDLRSVIAAPQAVIMAALILFFLAVAPGFPFLPFVIIGVLSLSLLLVVSRFASRSDPQFLQLKDSGGGNLLISGTQILLEDSRASDSGSITSSNLRQNQQASLVELLIEIDQEFLSQYFMREDVQSAGQAFANQIRSSIFLSRGLSLPNLRFQTSSTLGDSVFSITIRNNSVYRGYLRLDEVWVCATRFTLDGFGIKITSFESNPINGLPGFWVAANSAQLKALNELGIDIYTPIKFVVLQAYGNALSSIDKLFGLVEVKELLRSSSNECQPLVEEIFDKGMLTVVEFSEVLRRLVREAIPINDIKLILEGIAEYATTAEPEIARAEWMSELHTCLRLKFAQAIIRSAISPGDHLRLFSVSVSVEEEFRESLSLWDKFRTVPPVDPEIGNKFCINAENIFRPVIERGLLPIAVVCSEDVRYAVQEYLNHYFHSRPWIKILSYEELRGQENVESVAVLN